MNSIKTPFFPVIAGVIAVLLMSPATGAGGENNPDSGKRIRQSVVKQYSLDYYLIDIRQAMEEYGKDGPNSATHHLMLYITGPDGRPVTGAKVGFLIEGPRGSGQKVMAMGMKNGYGADVFLGHPGQHTIKAKAVAEGKILTESFTYKVP